MSMKKNNTFDIKISIRFSDIKFEYQEIDIWWKCVYIYKNLLMFY